jgi:hypothetical protein
LELVGGGERVVVVGFAEEAWREWRVLKRWVDIGMWPWSIILAGKGWRRAERESERGRFEKERTWAQRPRERDGILL